MPWNFWPSVGQLIARFDVLICHYQDSLKGRLQLRTEERH